MDVGTQNMGISCTGVDLNKPISSRDTHNAVGGKQPSQQTPSENEEWEMASGWIYMGLREWAQNEEQQIKENKIELDRETQWIYTWRCHNDQDIKLHQAVMEGGYPNRWEARRPVKTQWNLEKFEELLENYDDKEVVEWIRYG